MVKRLQAVGFSEQQAEVLAEEQAKLIDEKLATKRDLADLKNELLARISESESRMTIRLGGMLVVGVTAVAALTKIL